MVLVREPPSRKTDMAINPARCIESSRRDIVPSFFQPVCTKCSRKRHLRDRQGLDDELSEAEEAMGHDRMNDHGIRRLRIASYTQATNLQDEREHASLLAKHYSLLGRRAEAELLELSLWHDDSGMPRLYDVVGEGPDARATLKDISI
jgi:hypothetical protein